MANFGKLNLRGLTARPNLPNPGMIQGGTKSFESAVEIDTRIADATIAVTDAIMDSTPGAANQDSQAPAEANISDESEKLSRLVDDDFPFDESQLEAVEGLANQKYGCLIGAAGTGKTTVTKKLVDRLRDSLDEIDVSQYWKRGVTDEHDDYEAPARLIPSIVMVSFTGRASQMTKKNFPRDWHPNIMTIHRALGFYPEFYEDFDSESDHMVNKRRFVPAYTAEQLMPWDIVIIDEAGMLGLDLWHQLLAACKPECRIIMIGDINQLPPTHGKSILGFALAQWPTWELTHVHRQQGANNSIVDNAHRILKGLRPISDSGKTLSIRPDESAKDPKDKVRPMLETLNFLTRDPDWRVAVVEMDEQPGLASARLRQLMKLLHGKIYEPNRDVLITCINGYEQSQPGYQLGQAPLNQNLVTALNQDQPRYIIDAGREKQNFAVGDKVMATVNDYEAGITNGMTGIITSIAINGGYGGDSQRFGLISDVNAYFDSIDDEEEDQEEISIEDLMSNAESLEAAKERAKRDAGPASHIVSVRFGEGEHAFDIAFSTKSQVASLMLAYAATCHKMQGGEAPLVFVIVHQTHKRSLCREWFYTAVTRASQRCVIFTTRQGLGFALGKQNIKGTTLSQKIKTFVELTASGLLGPSVRVKLPQARSLVTDVAIPEPKFTRNDAIREAPRPQVVFRDRIIPVAVEVVHRHEWVEPTPVDGGELHNQVTVPAQLPAPARLVSQWGAIHMKLHLDAIKDGPRLLTHQPAEPSKQELDRTPITCPRCGVFHAGGFAYCDESRVKPEPPKAFGQNKLAMLLAKQKKG